MFAIRAVEMVAEIRRTTRFLLLSLFLLTPKLHGTRNLAHRQNSSAAGITVTNYGDRRITVTVHYLHRICLAK
jgi:hypothetical protein